QFLDQTVVELATPFAGEERHDLLATDRELRAIAPCAVHGIGQRDALGIAAVPGVLGHADLLDCRLARERREGRSCFAVVAHGASLAEQNARGARWSYSDDADLRWPVPAPTPCSRRCLRP